MHPTKVFLESVGCYIVQTETNHIAAYLRTNGYDIVDDTSEADALILTTCAVTEKSANSTHNKLRELLEKRADNTPLYVVGCFTRIETARINDLKEKHENIHVVSECNEVEKIFQGNNSWDFINYNDFFSYPYFDLKLQIARRMETGKLKFAKKVFSGVDSILKTDLVFYCRFRQTHLYSTEVQTKMWPVIASRGCTHNCTFCAVRIGRGKYRSKPVPAVLNEMRKGAEKGYRKVLIIGDELGPYGVDFKDGTSIRTLLDAIIAENLPLSIGLWYIDCFHLSEAMPSLIHLAETDRLFFLGIPIQSGSARILKLMNRRYSLDDSVEAISRLRKYPGLLIASQIMVGFPTETEEDFQASLSIAKKGLFDIVEVYKFSPRPGTAAEKMENDVLEDVKTCRADKLQRTAWRQGKKLMFRHVFHELTTQGTRLRQK